MTIRSDIFAYLRTQTVGASSSDIATVCKTSKRNATKELLTLRAQGLADRTHEVGSNVRWAVWEHLPAARADVQRVSDELRAISAEKRKARDRARAYLQYDTTPRDFEPPDEKPFKHIIVNALEAKPLQKRGPASVWELA
jgi:hypothetical protein